MESKIGHDLRIAHLVGDLAGNSYGQILAHYDPMNIDPVKLAKLIETLKHPKRFYTKKEIALINNMVSTLPVSIVDDFEKNYKSWKSSWFLGIQAIDANPASRRTGQAYHKLLEMGTGILPLLIQKLMNKDDFFALQVYDHIQENEKLIIQPDPKSKIILEGEQGRAYRTVKAYLKYTTEN